ncbi:hypothetical protein HWV62_14452 [Athelia sp. TMB]|nr:hypothetical protein HWV62_14452 [Athelia sp. TMB]
MSSLERSMRAALASREARLICRRLPSPSEAALVDFTSNDSLSLASSPTLRTAFLAALQGAPDVLGSRGSRLLVNGTAHAELEARLGRFFGGGAEGALLFTSGLDANAGFFACVPQPGDCVVTDVHIHASVHDGLRASRCARSHYSFAHNSVPALRAVLLKLLSERPGLGAGEGSVFVAVESLYSMDGTFAPLTDIVEAAETLFPAGNAYVVVDEAHATGIYGPQGRGLVAALGLEERVFARLHTFGKALAGSGAVLLTTPLTRSYLLNYARPLIYTTALPYPAIVAASCAFDLLENGHAQKLAKTVQDLSAHFVTSLRACLWDARVPPEVLCLLPHLARPRADAIQSPIIALLTPLPRPLSGFLRGRGMNARPITWPTVPRGGDRVRVCLHAGNTVAEVDALVRGCVEWAEEHMRGMERAARRSEGWIEGAAGARVFAESKL